MNKLFKALFVGLLLVTSINAMAAFGIFWAGSFIWRDGQEEPGDAQHIAYEWLNDKVVYGVIAKLGDGDITTLDDGDLFKGLCDQSDNKFGKKLFNATVDGINLCQNPQLAKNFDLYRFWIKSARWNRHNWYYFIAPRSLWESGIKGYTIAEIQMGSTVNRTPPKLLRIMTNGAYTGTCKNTEDYQISIECNGWSYKSLDQYWGKDVPPEMKALNGTGVKPKVVNQESPVTQ